jgi:hypothetical protein
MARFSARSPSTEPRPRSRAPGRRTKCPPSTSARNAASRKMKSTSRATLSLRSPLSFVYVGNVSLPSPTTNHPTFERYTNFRSSSGRMSVTRTLNSYSRRAARLQRLTSVAALAPLCPLVPTQTLFMLQSCLLPWKERRKHYSWTTALCLATK